MQFHPDSQLHKPRGEKEEDAMLSNNDEHFVSRISANNEVFSDTTSLVWGISSPQHSFGMKMGSSLIVV